MSDTPIKPDAAPPQTRDKSDEPELTDGFHLLIDALQLNDLNTIYGVPGIPITDLGRFAQAAGMRVLSFRHEQHAGNAAAVAGYLTKKPGLCLTVSAPGFLDGLTAKSRRSVVTSCRSAWSSSTTTESIVAPTRSLTLKDSSPRRCS